MQLLSQSQINRIKNKDIVYFNTIDNPTLLKLAFSKSIATRNKQMIEYFLERGCTDISVFCIRESIAKNDNVEYIKYLDSKGIDIFHGTGVNLFCAMMDEKVKITEYMLSNVEKKCPNFDFKILAVNMVDAVYGSRKNTPKNSEKYDNFIVNLLKKLTPEHRTKVLGYVKSQEIKIHLHALYLEQSLTNTANKKNKNKI